MKAVPMIEKIVAGVAQVRIDFIGDIGEWDVRPPIYEDAPDENGSISTKLYGCKKALEKLSGADGETRAATQVWIDEWSLMI